MSNEKKLWKYDELYLKLTKMHPKNGDVIILGAETDQYGDLKNSVNDIQKAVDNVYEVLEKAGIKAIVVALSDKITVNSVKNAKDAIRDLQNVIDYIKLAMGQTGDSKNKESEKKKNINNSISIDTKKLAEMMSFKGEEETQVSDSQ